MTSDERNDLLAQLAACQERLAAYVDVVADVVERLGHEGNEPDDLLDALGEIEGMLAGKVTNEPHDLTGLSEVCRQALWHRDRARLLLADARSTCDHRAAERDAAILERDAAARELVRILATQVRAVLIFGPGPCSFHEAAAEAIAAVTAGRKFVAVIHNGVQVNVQRGDTPNTVAARWRDACTAAHATKGEP